MRVKKRTLARISVYVCVEMLLGVVSATFLWYVHVTQCI